jgi:trigger factor
MGDVAVVDYRGRFADASVDEEAIPGTEAIDFQMELADGRFVSGMVEGVVGMNPSETKEVTVTFPEDYPHEDLAGKEVIFTISLKEIKEKELPELDDDLAQEVSEFETLAELKASLESQFQEKAEKATKSAIHEAILEQLVQISAVDLPESLIEKEVNNLLTQTAMQMQNYGMDIKRLFTPEMVSQMRQRSRPDAITNLQKSLILLEIAEKESIEVDLEKYEAKVKEVQEQLADRDVDVERLRAMIKEDLLSEATLDWIQTKATVELVPQGSLTPVKTDEEEEFEEEETEAAEMTVEAETSEA